MRQSRDIRWIFLDLGNTLIDERKAIDDRIEQIRQAFVALGKSLSAKSIECAFEQASAEFAPRLVARALEKLGDPAEGVFVLGRIGYRKELEEPYPAAYAVVPQLAARHRIGVIANQSPGTRSRLDRYDLLPAISLCLASAEAGLAKPDAALFQLALERARCEPEQAVMVGDRLDNDIRPAKQLGWGTVRVLQGFARVQVPRDADEEPDWTVEHLEEILEILCEGVER